MMTLGTRYTQASGSKLQRVTNKMFYSPLNQCTWWKLDSTSICQLYRKDANFRLGGSLSAGGWPSRWWNSRSAQRIKVIFASQGSDRLVWKHLQVQQQETDNSATWGPALFSPNVYLSEVYNSMCWRGMHSKMVITVTQINTPITLQGFSLSVARTPILFQNILSITNYSLHIRYHTCSFIAGTYTSPFLPLWLY